MRGWLRLQLAIALFGATVLAAGLSRRAANLLHLHAWGKTEYAKPAKIYLALCTVVPTSSSTGVTITEATGATGYERKELTAASIEGTEAEESLIEYIAELVFKAITAGSATIIGWAVVDSAETNKGNVVDYGSCTSTVISSTQTPPVIAAKALKAGIK